MDVSRVSGQLLIVTNAPFMTLFLKIFFGGKKKAPPGIREGFFANMEAAIRGCVYVPADVAEPKDLYPETRSALPVLWGWPILYPGLAEPVLPGC